MPDERFEIERFQGVVETGPAPGEVVFHATVWHTNDSGNRSKNGFVFHARPDATPEELQLAASVKWGGIQSQKLGM